MAVMSAPKEAAKRKFDRWAGRYERDRRSRFNARPQQEALAALALLRSAGLSGVAVRFLFD